MHVTLLCIDTTGGIVPYIALAHGLRRAGHTPAFIVPQHFVGLIERHGFGATPLAGDMESMLQQDPSLAGVAEKGFMVAQAQVARTITEHLPSWTQTTLEACRATDLLIGGFAGVLVGSGAAEKAGIPFVQAHLQPMTPTGAFGGLLMPAAGRWAQGLPNRLSHQLTMQVLWQPLRGAVNRARREVLRLPPESAAGRLGRTASADEIILYAFSRHLVPKPPDWPANVHVTGAWFLEEPEPWQPPQALVEFLAAGEPPISIGFGSMMSSDAARTTDLIVEAVARSGRRAVLLAGWGGLRRDALPPTIFAMDAAPHSWLFPCVALAVHHGGAGTTHAAVRAGIPAVVVPFGADQPFWARAAERAGAALAPLPRKQLTAPRLTDAITAALAHPSLAASAARLGEQVRAEEGVETAVRLIEQHAGR